MTARAGRIARPLLLAALVAVAGANLLAWRHARAFTRFGHAGDRTPAPESIDHWARLRTLVSGVHIPRPENSRTPDAVGLPFATETVESEPGVRLELWRIPAAGTPTAVALLCHGYAGCKAGMLEAALDFHRRGLEVWMLDFRGCGGSAGTETSVGWHEARDVAAVSRRIREVRPGLPLVLHGSSMGAAAILGAVAREGIAADALVLECPFNSLVDTVGNRFHLLGLPAFPFAHLLAFWGGVQQGFPALRYRPADDARAVRCPTLLLLGEHDRRVTVEQGREIAANLGPASRTVVLPACGHESAIACEPAAWEYGLNRILAALPATAATRAQSRGIAAGMGVSAATPPSSPSFADPVHEGAEAPFLAP